jgi:hypothetical protein
MKLSNGDSIIAGVAEVSVDKLIALEKSVTDKDQTIGALRETIKGLEVKIDEVRAEATAKQAMVLIQKNPVKKSTSYHSCTSCGWNYYIHSCNSCPNCGQSNPITESESKEYKNLDTVIEDIRKDEAKKLGIDLAEYDKKINELTLEKAKVQNKLNFELKETKEQLKQTVKEREADIQAAKEKIRKHLGGIVDEQEKELDDLRDTLKKLKNDKTDEAVEAARKQEIIDLKVRIAELEKQPDVPNFGWFKSMIYNWLDVDGRAKVQAERENLEKKEQINKISNDYPSNKNWWAPVWMQDWNW